WRGELPADFLVAAALELVDQPRDFVEVLPQLRASGFLRPRDEVACHARGLLVEQYAVALALLEQHARALGRAAEQGGCHAAHFRILEQHAGHFRVVAVVEVDDASAEIGVAQTTVTHGVQVADFRFGVRMSASAFGFPARACITVHLQVFTSMALKARPLTAAVPWAASSSAQRRGQY